MPDPAEEAAREMEALLVAARQPLIDNVAFTIAGQRLAPERIVEVLSPLMTEARLDPTIRKYHFHWESLPMLAAKLPTTQFG